MLLLATLAFAHPGSAPGAPAGMRDHIGHRVEIVVDGETVVLAYVAEIPERRVLAEAREATAPGYGERLLDTLAGEVKLTWDGAPLPATRVPIADAVKAGDGGFLDFAVSWKADLPGTTGTLGVRNGNYPEDPGFFATSVTLGGGWMADETSLLKVRNGRLRDNWHGAWVKDESAREPWVKIRPALFFERASEPQPLPKRMTGLDGGGPPKWFFGVLALSLIPIAWLGRKLGERARRLRQ